MTTVQHWDKFINGDSNEAVKMFADLYADTGDQPTLFNLGTALMDVEDWGMAREIFDTVIKHEVELGETGQSSYVKRGIIEWFDGKPKYAVDLWRLSLDTVYADEAGGVMGPALLWYAGYRLGDPILEREGQNLLKKFRIGPKTQAINFWPGARGVASYILDEVDQNIFLNQWKYGPEDHTLEIRRLCRARFWAGVKESSRPTKWDLFEAAISNKHAILEPEYFLARWELRQL